MLDRYLELTGADPEAFRAEAALLAAQRNLKILGLFTRLCRRDGKPRYLAHLPASGRNLTARPRPPLPRPPRRLRRRATSPRPSPAVLARIEAGA